MWCDDMLRLLSLLVLVHQGSALRLPAARAGLSRRAVTTNAAALLGVAAVPFAPPARADSDSSAEVMHGVLQLNKGESLALGPGASATVTMRVVGRNTKGPIATAVVPLEGASFPVRKITSHLMGPPMRNPSTTSANTHTPRLRAAGLQHCAVRYA